MLLAISIKNSMNYVDYIENLLRITEFIITPRIAPRRNMIMSLPTP